MSYTATQIERAEKEYSAMLHYRTVESYGPEFIGWAAAEQRCEYHNNIVREILAGNAALEREWKTFFLNEAAKSDRKASESRDKKSANKAASSDVLAQVKASGRKLGDYYKWLNSKGNPFRSEFFSKNFSQESVNQFISL